MSKSRARADWYYHTTAVHEAAHAVIVMLFGGEVTKLQILLGGHSYCRHGKVKDCGFPLLAAGYLAEHMIEWRTDEEEAVRYLLALLARAEFEDELSDLRELRSECRARRFPDQVVENGIRYTYRLLKANWRSVRAVAARLERGKRLGRMRAPARMLSTSNPRGGVGIARDVGGAA